MTHLSAREAIVTMASDFAALGDLDGPLAEWAIEVRGLGRGLHLSSTIACIVWRRNNNLHVFTKRQTQEKGSTAGGGSLGAPLCQAVQAMSSDRVSDAREISKRPSIVSRGRLGGRAGGLSG